jgi:nucleoside-diphosphate kinase
VFSRPCPKSQALTGRIKSLTPSPALAKEHYIDLASRPFYAGLVKYITSGTPVVAMVWEGKDVIRQGVSVFLTRANSPERY